MSDTVELKSCPKCGAPIPAEAPQGLCPKCLLAQASAPTEGAPPEAAQSKPPSREDLGKAFPQLEILELIGQGGMGFVFKARQPKLERFVALKILPQSLACDPAFAERFAREGRVLARLNHPNIVTVYDFGQANGFFYLLMEYVDGVNLRQAMRVGRFTPGQALGVVPKICEALQFAHEEGVLHRDIKPENILLDSKGRVKIADFGIAKLLGSGFGVPASAGPGVKTKGGHPESAVEPKAPPHSLTETGRVFGTPHYMAPEQIENPKNVDQRADIYSLGVVFYEMLTGELPLGRFAPPSAKSEVDSRVDEIVLKALEKEREHRQRSAGEVKTQVETVAQTPVLPNGKADRGPDRFWRRFAIGAAAVLLAVISIPILLFFGLLVPSYHAARSREQAQIERVKLERVAATEVPQGRQQGPATETKQSSNGINLSASQTTLHPLSEQTLSGPEKERAQLKLRFAENQLADAQKQRNAGAISQLEYEKFKLDRDVAQAELKGSAVDSVRLKLQFAERALAEAKNRYDAGMAPASEYERAKLDRDLAAINVREAEEPASNVSARPLERIREYLDRKLVIDPVRSPIADSAGAHSNRWVFKALIPPNSLAEFWFVHTSNGVPTIDYPVYYKVGNRPADVGLYFSIDQHTNCTQWNVNLGLGATAGLLYCGEPSYRFELPHSRIVVGLQSVRRIELARFVPGDGAAAEGGCSLYFCLTELHSPPVRSVPSELETTNYVAGQGLTRSKDEALRFIKGSLQSSADLRTARARLAELRVDYGDRHPAVLTQIKCVEELERMDREEPDAPADLREARVRLIELRADLGPNHPKVLAQTKRIEELERMTREEPDAPEDLRQAWARLAGLGVGYGETHPEVLAQRRRIEELERIKKEEPDAAEDLREAKATLAELRTKYTDTHPVILQQLARIKALEGK